MFTQAFYEAQNAAQAAVIALRQEGIATYAEYLVSQELGTVVRGGEQLQRTLNDPAKKYSPYSAEFKEAAIVASASAYMSVTPSTAPNLTYGEFYSEAWYANKAGLDPNAISWQTTYSNDIQTVDIGGGITRVTTSRPIAVGTPGIVSTKSFSLDVNSSGQVVKQFTTIDSYDGFRYAQVRGDGQYYLNDTIVSAGQSDTGTLYATVIGNGNDLYVFDGNEIRLVGQENYLVTNGSDRIVVEGDHNTLDVNGHVDSIVINDKPVPNYIDSISYIGDNAVGFGNSDVSWGSNWPGKEYDVPQAPPQNRTAPSLLPPAAPLYSTVANVVGLSDADVPELIVV
ncbi:hypothetical protein [Massilia sp. YMA4]|uniref:hypothetical protein n=1 Tax=Massilia sp. YMA4 TaxID=1593482 RepID=UPI001582AA52|nr:hypothetical protein [Massilia sp. YMA4]